MTEELKPCPFTFDPENFDIRTWYPCIYGRVCERLEKCPMGYEKVERMVTQEEALVLVREHPDFTVHELTDLNDWGDLKKYDNYKARMAYRTNLVNKLLKLLKFGLVERNYVNGKPTWRAVE